MKKINSDLRITLVQSSLVWEDRESNLSKFHKSLSGLKPKETDLIVLPEMFNSGFTMNASEVAESMDGPTIQWMKSIALSKKAVVTGSLVIKEKNSFFNRLVWVDPDGKVSFYDKRHLFGMAGEDKVYTAGKKRLIVSLKGWTILPLICYDIRFPVWSRNDCDYDLAIFIANWPERRRHAWSQLLIARAIENLAFVVGVNRVGKDGLGITYKGDSAIIDPLGGYVKKLPSGSSRIETVILKHEEVVKNRKWLPFLKDRDQFKIKI